MSTRTKLAGATMLVLIAAGAWWMTTHSKPAQVESTPAATTKQAPTAPYIAGFVVDSTGAPIENATVEIDADMEATTDAEGRFRIDGLEGGTYQLDARAAGYAAAGPRAMRLVEVVLSGEGDEKGVDDLELVLRRPAKVSGRVVAAGRPVEGAQIGVYVLFADGMAGRLEPFVVDEAARTGDDGAFAISATSPRGA